MANFNKVFLMGNLTRDPELKYVQSGMAVVEFGMAVNRKYRNRNNEMIEETTFVDIEGWGKQAETFNQYMRKGRPVFVEGRLKLNTWETADGQKRSKMRVVMEGFQFMGGGAPGRDGPRDQTQDSEPRGRVQAGKVAERPGSKSQPGEDYDFDDIPF